MIKAATGYFSNGDAVEPEAWIEPDGLGKLDERMFVARAVGRSMEPTIHDGDFIVFRSNLVGTHQGKIVLAQYRGPADPDTGGSFTVKKYSSEKRADPDTDWRHTRIVLSPINREYQPIVVPEDQAEHFRIFAEFVAVLGR
jgi:SOS-response transcriptional repressor LexA